MNHSKFASYSIDSFDVCLFSCQEVETFYSSKGAEGGPYLDVTFNGDEVSLNIPEDGITLPSGWSLLPLAYPTKVRVYSFCIYSIFYQISLPLISFSVVTEQCGQLQAWPYHSFLPDTAGMDQERQNA